MLLFGNTVLLRRVPVVAPPFPIRQSLPTPAAIADNSRQAARAKQHSRHTRHHSKNGLNAVLAHRCSSCGGAEETEAVERGTPPSDGVGNGRRPSCRNPNQAKATATLHPDMLCAAAARAAARCAVGGPACRNARCQLTSQLCHCYQPCPLELHQIGSRPHSLQRPHACRSLQLCDSATARISAACCGPAASAPACTPSQRTRCTALSAADEQESGWRQRQEMMAVLSQSPIGCAFIV